MSSKTRTPRRIKRASKTQTPKNGQVFQETLQCFVDSTLFSQSDFHGNVKWKPEQVAMQALVWSWQETKLVTDAFEHSEEVCNELALNQRAKSYTSLTNALTRYRDVFSTRLRTRFQALTQQVASRYFETSDWVLMGFDGSRATAPRSASNERAFCAPNYGNSYHAKGRKKKETGKRCSRTATKPEMNSKPQPQVPQVWITLMWHMGLRLPWTWRLGPSHSSERDHVKEMLRDEKFQSNTLFCGDAGFTGYPLWSQIISQGYHFLVRIGGNVQLLSEKADIKQAGGGRVLCWPKGKMDSGQPPLALRLIKVKVGKTSMWMLTSVLDCKRLGITNIVRFYKMRWGIEVEFRGLKQTIEKRTLRCRNPQRLLTELDWSIRAMAVAELLALRAQMRATDSKRSTQSYDAKDRSLAKTMRALRKCMRMMEQVPSEACGIWQLLSEATVDRYNNRTDKRARYQRKNPDHKPLGDPKIRKLNVYERNKLAESDQSLAT